MASSSYNRFAVLQEKEHSNTTHSDDILPKEVWYSILAYLDLKSLGNLRSTDRMFFSLVNRFLKYNNLENTLDYQKVSVNIIAQNNKKWMEMLRIRQESYPSLYFWEINIIDKYVYYTLCEEIMKGNYNTVSNLINFYHIRFIPFKTLNDIFKKHQLSDYHKESLKKDIKNKIRNLQYNINHLYLHVVVLAYISGSISLAKKLLNQTNCKAKDSAVYIDGCRWADLYDIPSLKGWLGDIYFMTDD